MMMLAGKVALVTGSSLGIGAGTAVVLARHGADVAVNYRQSPQEAQVVLPETLGGVPDGCSAYGARGRAASGPH